MKKVEEMKYPECPDCKIPMEVTRETDEVICFKCRCGRTEKKIKERKIYVQS